MRISTKRSRHEFEAGDATFYSTRNFAGIGVAGDVSAATADAGNKNWCHELIRAVITGWKGVLDEDGKPLAFHESYLDGIPPEPAIELAQQVVELQRKEAGLTEEELGESEASADSSSAGQSGKGSTSSES